MQQFEKIWLTFNFSWSDRLKSIRRICFNFEPVKVINTYKIETFSMKLWPLNAVARNALSEMIHLLMLPPISCNRHRRFIMPMYGLFLCVSTKFWIFLRISRDCIDRPGHIFQIRATMRRQIKMTSIFLGIGCRIHESNLHTNSVCT